MVVAMAGEHQLGAITVVTAAAGVMDIVVSTLVGAAVTTVAVGITGAAGMVAMAGTEVTVMDTIKDTGLVDPQTIRIIMDHATHGIQEVIIRAV